jgi:L-lactate dehydrogenase (cytochrome)
MIAVSPLDYRESAQRRIPAFLFGYLDGGAGTEVTLRRNMADLEAVSLRQRVLRDVSHIDISTELLGQKLDLPLVLGPIGLAGLTARRGEVQAARAAEAANVPFTLSTVSACSIDEVRKATTRPFWFQIYMMRDRGFMRELLARAVEAGCSTLMFTVDMPVAGARYRDYRTGLNRRPDMKLTLDMALRRIWQIASRPGWAWDVGIRGRPLELGNLEPVLTSRLGDVDISTWVEDNFDPSITWRDLEFIRSEWKGTLIIKGIMDPDDAREAAGLGADGIVVSNHGGRQLDGAPSTVHALPAIADAIGDSLTILADGGVRSGLDVMRMLALGAKAVLLGRAWAYALASGGEKGVAHLLQLMEKEMRVAMALTGVTGIAGINRDILAGS